MESSIQPAGGQCLGRIFAISLCLILAADCSKAPRPLNRKAVLGDALSAGMYQRFGWELINARREDEDTTAYIFERPANHPQSVRDAIAEASAIAKDKARLADKELTEIEKTDGTK